MAITFTNLGASANPDINSQTDATSYANSSWTPPSSGLICVFVLSRQTGGPPQPTISGNSLTWTAIATVTRSTVWRLTLFGADASGSSTGATTVDFAGNTQIGCTASFFLAEGVDLSGGVAAAFVQAPTADGNNVQTLSVTLAAAGAADNRAVAGFFHAAQEATTPRTNWDEQDDLSDANPPRALETQTRADAFETTASATWASAVVAAAIAAELKASGGGAVNTEEGGAKAPAVGGGADQAVFSEGGQASSPPVAGGADQSVFVDLAGAQSPAVAGAADQSVFSEGGQGTSTAQAGGASQLIQRGREGGAQSPAVAGGADTVTYTEQAGGYAPATASGLDQMVYTETGGVSTPAVAGGESVHIAGNVVYSKTGGAQSPAVASGADSVVSADTGGAAAPVVAGGRTGAGSASSGSWVPFGDHFAGMVGPEVTYGTSLKDRMKREQVEQPARVAEDEALLMLL